MVIGTDHQPEDDFERFIALPTEAQGIIILAIGAKIHAFVAAQNFGRVGVHILHHVPQDRQNYRLPDISFTADTTTPVVTAGAVLRLPDLAVEVKSPSDSYRQMRDKADYYLANGVKLVWLVYPEKRIIVSYVASGEIQLLNEADALEGGDVLPGFSMAVSEVFLAVA